MNYTATALGQSVPADSLAVSYAAMWENVTPAQGLADAFRLVQQASRELDGVRAYGEQRYDDAAASRVRSAMEKVQGALYGLSAAFPETSFVSEYPQQWGAFTSAVSNAGRKLVTITTWDAGLADYGRQVREAVAAASRAGEATTYGIEALRREAAARGGDVTPLPAPKAGVPIVPLAIGGVVALLALRG